MQRREKVFQSFCTDNSCCKTGWGDPNMNPTLRLYIDKAKAVGFSNENVEKAIKKVQRGK